MLEARNKPIITLLDDIRRYVMSKIVEKRGYVEKQRGDYGPNIVEKIVKERKKIGKWQVKWNKGSRHEVFWDNLVINARKGYVILLGSHSCSCGKWDKSGIPCQHAIAAITFEGIHLFDYMAEWFRKNIYLKAYQLPINSIRERQFQPTSEESPLEAPMARRMPTDL